VDGVRHKELRIKSPIPISQLPGGRRKNLGSTFDYVSKPELDEIVFNLKSSIEAKDKRIAALEEQIAVLKESGGSAAPSDGDFEHRLTQSKLEHLLAEIEKVRPAERKLVLKLAKAIQAHEQFLERLGLNKQESESSEE
jgi:hypothetical protein